MNLKRLAAVAATAALALGGGTVVELTDFVIDPGKSVLTGKVTVDARSPPRTRRCSSLTTNRSETPGARAGALFALKGRPEGRSVARWRQPPTPAPRA
jgi:hypothetical protein